MKKKKDQLVTKPGFVQKRMEQMEWITQQEKYKYPKGRLVRRGTTWYVVRMEGDWETHYPVDPQAVFQYIEGLEVEFEIMNSVQHGRPVQWVELVQPKHKDNE